ncbi:MAG: fibronectin type III domain-containing protein [Sphingomonadales bacterium]
MLAGKGLLAQNFPVQASLQLFPPYTPQLSALQTTPQRVGITLLNKDLTVPQLDVFLKLQLQGPGITLQTRSGYIPATTFTLTAGVPLQLSGADIAELLQPQNLDFQGLDKNAFIRSGQILPEGLWQFTVTAFSTARNLQVSNPGTAMAGLFKHKPPLLNFPFDGSRAGSALPQYLAFQWTSRHYASPFAAGSIRYRFKLIELIPGNRNPNEAMQATLIPWFETFTDQNSYIYGPADPPLVPGRAYAWQVQAVDVDGSEAFENDGYSQVFGFVFGEACSAPLRISVQSEPGRAFRVHWTPVPGTQSAAYGLWYRQKGIGEWKMLMVTDTTATVGGLLPQTGYEMYVNRMCIGGESPPTATVSITTDTEQGAWNEVSKQCGKPAPVFDLSNRKPLPSLSPGETFTAADFTVKVLYATGQNGEFSGTGTVWLPFTGKVPIPCTWENVSINSDRRLVSGMVRILRQPLVISNLAFEKLADRWRDWFGSNWNRGEYKPVSAPVSGVEVTPDGRVRIRTGAGEETVRGGKNTVIIDPTGKRWYVSAGGKVTGPEGPGEKPIVGNEATGEGMPGSVLPDGTMVLFDNDSKNTLAWDAHNIRTQTGGDRYDRLDGPSGGYMAGWKLLNTGKTETLRATLRKGKIKLHPDSTRFVRSDGVRIKAQKLNDSVWVLEVPGRLHLWADAVWAVGNMLPQDSGKASGRRVLGKVNLLSVDERRLHVRLVPVDGSGGGVSAANVEQEMRPYMQTLGIRATVAVEKNLTVPGYSAGKDKLPVNRKRLNTAYGKELQRIVTAWEAAGRAPRGDTAVVFLTGPAADDTKGYMGLNNPYGFVFCGGEKPSVHTLSHELGHGLLVLEHPFGEDEGKAGQTRNLMDYNAPNGLSHMRQWQRIHDKEEVGNFLRGLRQKELEGKMMDWTLFSLHELGLQKGKGVYHSFITPNGKVITLAADSLEGVTFSRSYVHTGTQQFYFPRAGKANGALTAFIYAGKKYGPFLKGKWFRGFYPKETNSTRRFDSGWVMRKSGSAKEQVVAGVEVETCQLRVYRAGFSPLTLDTCPWEFKLTDSSFISSHNLGNACYEYFDEESLTKYAKQFWDSAKLNPNYPANKDIVRRIVRLIHDFGDEYPFYDVRSYDRFITKYRPKFSLPSLSPTTPFKTASLQTYENYLRLHQGVLVNIEAAFAEVKTYEDLRELLSTLPAQYYPKLTFRQRLRSLKMLTTNGLSVLSWRGWLENGGTEAIALKLLFTSPESERSMMLDSLVSGPAINGRAHLLAAMCADVSGLDDDNFNRFIGDLTKWIFEYRKPADENLVKSVEEGRYLIFDPGIWGEAVKYWFDNKGQITLSVRKNFTFYKLETRLHPYDWLNIQFTGATQYLNMPIRKGSTLRLPALFAYGIFNHVDRERLGAALETTLDIALLAVGVGEISLALKAGNGLRKAYLVTKSIADLTAGLGDLVVSNVLADKLNETNTGREFLNSWNTFQLYYGLGSLGLSGGEALVKQLRKQADDITQTAGNLTRAEKDEVEKIVAEVERKVANGGRFLTSLKKLVGKASSENILWKNLDESNIIWSNPNSNILSTAKSFANETGTSLYDAVLTDGYYVKFDLNDGRILLGNTNGNYHAFAVLNDADLGAFKSSVLNVSDEVFNTKLSQLLSTNADKLKVLSGVVSKQLNIAGKTIALSSNKINTFLGRFRPDVANLFNELGSFKNVGLGEVPGGINILNKPDYYYDASKWWTAYNKPWLDKAILRGDDIYLATIPTKADDIIKNGRLNGSYAEELNHLAQKNYKPVNLTTAEWNNIKSWLGH